MSGRALRIGDRVGSFRLVGQLGEGGMGLVFAAEHETIGKRAAVKVLLPQHSANPEFVRRFFNEARAVTQLRHPGLIDVYDFGQHELGCAYLVMELLDGESLAARLARERPLPNELIVELALQSADVLAAVHRRGIIHRDLKPDNLFLVPDPLMALGVRVKVLDFGIAKLTDADTRAARTRTGALLGTPAYMAPEQCRGLPEIDRRADLYSLGCILYEMAAGRPPFLGEGLGDVLAAHIYESPPPLWELAPQLSPALAAVIARAMAKKPDERYSSAEELAAELAAPSRAPRPRTEMLPTVRLPTLNAAAKPTRTTLGGAAAEVAAARTSARARRAVWPAAAAAVTLLAMVAIAALRSGGHRGDVGGTPPPVAVAAQPEEAPAERVLPSAAAPPSATVHIAIDSVPPGAAVLRASDQTRLGVTPWSTEVPRSDEHLVYLLRAHGFRQAALELDPSDDRQRTVRLEPSRKTSRPRPSPPATKPLEFNAP